MPAATPPGSSRSRPSSMTPGSVCCTCPTRARRRHSRILSAGACGGGRKPKGTTPIRSQLTVRIPDELRIALEENVARRRKRRPSWNLTEEVLGRLYWSYRKQEEERRDPYMKALAHLISAVAEQVHYRRSLSKEWHRDPFMYRAFKRGVIKLLDTLEPVGEANPPFNIKGLRERPEKKLWQAMA